MQLQTTPNTWSCLPTSLGMVIGVTLEYITHILGHDGSQILWPQLDDPFCRRAFSVNEMIYIALKVGFGLVNVADSTVELPDEENANLQGFVISVPSNTFLDEQLNKYNALLLGESENGQSHAVAWNANRQLVFDPRGSRYTRDLFRTQHVLIAVPISQPHR